MICRGRDRRLLPSRRSRHVKRSLRRRRRPSPRLPLRLILDRTVSLDVKRRLFLGLAKICHNCIRLSNDWDCVVVPILLSRISHEPLERPLMGLLRASFQLHGHELAISHYLENRVASRHALVEVTRPKYVYLPPRDGRIYAPLWGIDEPLLVLEDRGRCKCRLLLNVCREGIQRRLGGAREHRV
jgi:hypothetical protein